MFKRNVAFSLVELMITVAILGSGIVLILRSFLSSAYTLDSLRSRIKALEIADCAANELEEASLEDGGVKESVDHKEAILGLRKAEQITEVDPFVVAGSEENSLARATISIKWKEAGRGQDVVMVSYYHLKK